MRTPAETGTSKTIVAAALTLAAAGASALPSTAADRPSAATAGTATVEVGDNRYSPKRLTVVKGTRVEWVWSHASDGRHDVYLDQRPQGAARFRSPPATAPFSFSRKLRKPGTYKVLCTLHAKMRMRIDVSG